MQRVYSVSDAKFKNMMSYESMHDLTSSSLSDDNNNDNNSDHNSDHNIHINKYVTRSSNRLGTFGGVFVPCVLSIFGVILFERLGWIVGQAGLYQVFLMFTLAYIVVIFTTLSLSTLATNGNMKSGGCYYLCSRSLGPEFGGAIGIIFTTANICGASVYLIGFAEAIIDILPTADNTEWTRCIIALIALVIMTIICFIGADMYVRVSYLIFIIMIVSLLVVFFSLIFQNQNDSIGFETPNSVTLRVNMHEHYNNYSFFKVFAVLFPAVTGIMAGANMSGDLKNAGKSIPTGTLSALAFSYVIYLSLCFLIASSCSYKMLRSKEGYQILRQIAFVKWIITSGICVSTLSSSMGALIGGAKILQSLARDNLLPILHPFSQGSKHKDEAQLGLIFIAILVAIILLVSSNLNELASYQTLFFLLSYAVVNFACLCMQIQGSINFRPKFKSSKIISFLGIILCIVAMFLSEIEGTLISFVLCCTFIYYIHYRAPLTTWGSVSKSIIYHTVRKYLLRLDENDAFHLKFWRPNIILFINSIHQYRLIHLCNNIKKGGLFLISNIVLGDITKESNLKASPLIREAYKTRYALSNFIREFNLKAFAKTSINNNLRDGLRNMLLTAGLGAMKPNTICLGFHEKKTANIKQNNILNLSSDCLEKLHECYQKFPNKTHSADEILTDEIYEHMIQDCIDLGFNLIIGRHIEEDLPNYLVDGSRHNMNSMKECFNLFKKTKKQSSLLEENSSLKLKKYIDIWILPLDRFEPTTTRKYSHFSDSDDGGWNFLESPTAHFMVLLGYILLHSHQSSWATQNLRLCSVCNQRNNIHIIERDLKLLAALCRVEIKYFHVVCIEEQLLCKTPSVNSFSLTMDDIINDVKMNTIAKVDHILEEHCAFNNVMRKLSSKNETNLILLPLPPTIEEDEYINYVRELTDNLPPLLLCHAHKLVTTNEI